METSSEIATGQPVRPEINKRVVYVILAIASIGPLLPILQSSSISIATVSLSLVLAITSLVLLRNLALHPRISLLHLAFLPVLIVGIASAIVNGIGIEGALLLGVLLTSQLVLLVSSLLHLDGCESLIGDFFSRIAILIAVLSILNSVVNGFDQDGWFTRRNISMAILFLMIGSMAFASNRPLTVIAVVAGSAATLLTGSRTASALALALVVVAFGAGWPLWSGSRVWRWLLALGASWILLQLYLQVLATRFIEGSRGTFFGVEITTQGREFLNEVLINSSDVTPLGYGPGYTRNTLTALLGYGYEPHNEFLRALYDFGWVGVGALLIALLMLVILGLTSVGARAKFAVLGATLAIVGLMVTDNILVYGAVMTEAMLVIGLGTNPTLSWDVFRSPKAAG